MTASSVTSADQVWDLTDLPMLPHRRRLSATTWQVVWNITMSRPVDSPHTLNRFVGQYNNEDRHFDARARSMRSICLVITARQANEVEMTELAFALMRGIEHQYGTIERIENRSAEDWPMYRDPSLTDLQA